jgi:RNA polymerase sigma-70 factor (ECF subfamily)
MSETSVSLLERLRTAPNAALWQRLDDLYRPLIHRWLLRLDADLGSDTDDVTQEVLTYLFRELPTFERTRSGAFRAWVRAIAVFRLRKHWDRRRRQPRSLDGSDLEGVLAQLHDPASELSRQWDIEHHQHIIQGLLKQAAVDFEPKSMEAFRMLVFDGLSAATVAERLAMSPMAVQKAKSRILARLRQEGRGILD